MNENYDTYVALGHARLADRRRAEAAEAEVKERTRREKNRQKWLAHLQQVFDTIPSDLHAYISFNDAVAPCRNYYDTPEYYAYFTYVPFVPIRISTDRGGGDIEYAIGKAKRDDDHRYVEYTYDGIYLDILEAIAMADALREHNAEVEAHLDDEAEPAPPATPAKTSLQQAYLAAGNDMLTDAQLFALLSIAESLEAISYTLRSGVL